MEREGERVLAASSINDDTLCLLRHSHHFPFPLAHNVYVCGEPFAQVENLMKIKVKLLLMKINRSSNVA